MNIELLNTVSYCLLCFVLGVIVVGWFVCMFVWDKTRIGKMEDENRQLKKMIVQKELENDLLKCKVDALIDEQYSSTEAPADE